jgi:Tol biopolymer transport system component
MSGEHKVLGEEIQSYSHSDPKSPLSLRGLLVPRMMNSWVRKIVWSPDGTRLASLAFFSDELILWDVNANRAIKKIALGSSLNRLDLPIAFSADGKNLLVFNNSDAPPGATAGCMLLIDGHTGEIVRPLPCPPIDGKLTNLVLISPLHGQNEFAILLNSGSSAQMLSILDAATSRMTDTVSTLTNRRVPFYEHDMAISPDGHNIAILAGIRRPFRNKDGDILPFDEKISSLVIFDLLRKTQSSPILINEDNANSWASIVRYSPDGSKIAIGMANEDSRPIRLFDVSETKVIWTKESPIVKGGPKWGTIYDLDWSHDGRLIAFCGEDRTVNVLDAQSGVIIDSVATHGDCGDLAFNPDGTMLAYGTDHAVIVRRILPTN